MQNLSLRSSFGRKQLETIANFGKEPLTLHCSMMGTGKTYAICSGLVFYCLYMESLGIKGLNFVLLADTQSTAKRNICNVLSGLVGDDFKYDSSKKSGQVRDAKLFSHNLFICGLSDSKSVERFRGISNITGIIQEEASLSTEEQFALICSRLRGEYTESIRSKWPPGYCLRFWVGSTNPSYPTHWLKRKADSGDLTLIKWFREDARYEGAKAYFDMLYNLYKSMPQLLARNWAGEWTATEGAVYTNFSDKRHILHNMEPYYKGFKYCILSIDYGSSHPTAILLTGKTREGAYVVIEEVKTQHTAPSVIIKLIKELIFKVSSEGGTLAEYGVICDPSAVAIKDELNNNLMPYTNAINGHIEGISFISSLFEDDNLGILDTCPLLIEELYTYRYKEGGKDGEVVKVDDDLCDALRYGVYTDYKIRGGDR